MVIMRRLLRNRLLLSMLYVFLLTCNVDVVLRLVSFALRLILNYQAATELVSWVHLVLHLTNHVGLLFVLVVLGLVLRSSALDIGRLSIAILARSRWHNDVLDVVIDREVDGWLLHLDLLTRLLG
jgi:hypothetical protein